MSKQNPRDIAWLLNLYMEECDVQVKGETIVLPEDCRGTVGYLLCTVLNAEEEKIIRLLFEQYLSVSEMMELCGYTKGSMIGLIMRIIRKLRHPARSEYLRYGVAGVLEQTAEQIQHDSYLHGYQDGYALSKNSFSAVCNHFVFATNTQLIAPGKDC